MQADLDRVANAAGENATAVAARDEAIVAAHAAGHSLREIAAVANLSYGGVKLVIDRWPFAGPEEVAAALRKAGLLDLVANGVQDRDGDGRARLILTAGFGPAGRWGDGTPTSNGWPYDPEKEGHGPGQQAQAACDKIAAALAEAGMRILPHPHQMYGVLCLVAYGAKR